MSFRKMETKEERKFLECAILFLREELKASHGDLKSVCSEGRAVGGNYFPGGIHADVSLGNIYTTTKEMPARLITVSIGHNKKKFLVEEIYKIIKAK